MTGSDFRGSGWDRTFLSTSFEEGQLLPDLDEAAQEALRLAVGSGPEHLPAGKPGTGLSGVRALEVTAPAGGQQRRILFADLDLTIAEGTQLHYALCPVLDENLTYAATYAALDCQLADGTWVSDLGATDQHGFKASAAGQGEGKILLADHWNVVRIDLDAARGQQVVAIAVVLDTPGDSTGPVCLWADDVVLGIPSTPQPRGLTDYVDTRRGTHSSADYSRGNTVPATAMPNGFGFLVPLTDASAHRWMYSWAGHNDDQNRPRLQGVGISHIPSPWMGDRNQLAFHPASGDEVPDATLSRRALAFDHDTELARPHHYRVLLEGGHQVQMHPTDHGGLIQFTFPAGANTGHIILDAVSTEGAADPSGRPVHLDLNPERGTFTGWVDHGSPLSVGRSRMFITGSFDRAALTAGAAGGDRPDAKYLTFDTSAQHTVELRFATSFISTEQARHTYSLELAGATASEIGERARIAWEDRLGVLEVGEASAEQLATIYGNLYRLNLYPSSAFENAGSQTEPEPVHASPVADPIGAPTATHTGAAVVAGEMYVNHGFWDTYRTCWSAYALFYPELAARLADGFVQQYREGGWIARWSSPGYADLMTGTSSDVAFADLLARDVPLPDPLATYDAALRNATVVPPHPAVGRKGAPFTFLRGYVPSEHPESVSWTLEGYINDAGLAQMATRLAADPATPAGRRRALADEAVYFTQRARGYLRLYDADAGVFRGRDATGEFAPGSHFDPESWGGDYTESNAWNFAFHTPHDGAGLAHLHGGREGLAQLLQRFLTTPELAQKRGSYGQVIHEMVEARDVRMGQLGQSNQVSHHIPYMALFAGRPDITQELVRQIQARLWTGSEIGQGYHGDEDNGEMSAWHLLSALGLYPLWVGSEHWALGSPLFPRAVVHHPDGDLVIEAPGNTAQTPYVAGVRLDDAPLEVASITHTELLGGRRLRFEMASAPSWWGSVQTPPSLTPEGQVPEVWRDVSGAGHWSGGAGSVPSAGADVQVLADDLAESAVDLSQAVIQWDGANVSVLRAYTLTSAAEEGPAPAAWRLEVSTDGEHWTVVDERHDEQFPWPRQLRPFVLDQPVAMRLARLRVPGRGVLSQVELLVE